MTLGRYRWFAVFVDRVLTPTERALYRATSGRVTLAHAGDPIAVPELMLITRGHKSGLEDNQPEQPLDRGPDAVQPAALVGVGQHA